MIVTKQNNPVLPTFSNGLSAKDFNRPAWNKYAGEAGGFVAESRDGQFEVIAEPLKSGWQFWLVRISDGETIQEALCAS